MDRVLKRTGRGLSQKKKSDPETRRDQGNIKSDAYAKERNDLGESPQVCKERKSGGLALRRQRQRRIRGLAYKGRGGQLARSYIETCYPRATLKWDWADSVGCPFGHEAVEVGEWAHCRRGSVGHDGSLIR